MLVVILLSAFLLFCCFQLYRTYKINLFTKDFLDWEFDLSKGVDKSWERTDWFDSQYKDITKFMNACLFSSWEVTISFNLPMFNLDFYKLLKQDEFLKDFKEFREERKYY